MTPKILKTEEEYEAALNRVDELFSALPDTPEAEELELWVHLVTAYEKEHYPIPLPDPIEAIKFVMDQQGLKQADMVPYFGSKSKVSEVLSGKRPLSIRMIRSLHAGLDIPFEILLGEPSATLPPAPEGIKWDDFPLSEMVKRGWFSEKVKSGKELLEQAEELLAPFLLPDGVQTVQTMHLRQSASKSGLGDKYALWAWTARVVQLAKLHPVGSYNPEIITPQFISDIAHLSMLDNGPRVARDMLAKVGIAFVWEPHLPHTYLDGAAIRIKDSAPFVAMTFRYDRLDNFWYTLCHELAHIHLHLNDGATGGFFDNTGEAATGDAEREADALATDALIPQSAWDRFMSKGKPTADNIKSFAASLRIHPAIVSGRYRHVSGYSTFTSLIGLGGVKKWF